MPFRLSSSSSSAAASSILHGVRNGDAWYMSLVIWQMMIEQERQQPTEPDHTLVPGTRETTRNALAQV